MVRAGSAITIEARAKINLTLEILGKRPDGYHELDTVMARLDLADRLWLHRLIGQGEPVSSVDAAPYATLAALTAARHVEEDRAIAFAQKLDPQRLGSVLAYRTTDGTPMK